MYQHAAAIQSIIHRFIEYINKPPARFQQQHIEYIFVMEVQFLFESASMIFSTNASITANGSPGKSHSRIMGYNKVIQTPIQATSQKPCCFLNFLNWLSLLWVCCVKTPVNQSKGSPVTHSLLLRLNLFPTVGKLVKSGGVGCHIHSTKHTAYSGYIQVHV